MTWRRWRGLARYWRERTGIRHRIGLRLHDSQVVGNGSVCGCERGVGNIERGLNRRDGDGWEPKNRRIVRVRHPQISRKQGDLGLGGE
jgi:hypothetical protein